jgi:hypothetical protein
VNLPEPLPNFLGIGAPRAGTTWLHEVLDAHPDVLMPALRKEINFFWKDYHRGLEWYASTYRVRPGSALPARIGEITPMYMYHDICRKRIAELGTVDRFLVCLRDPVDLLWSGYKHNSAIYDFRGDLREFMEKFPHVVANGLYAQALRPWIDQFGQKAFVFVRFDDLREDPVGTRTAVAEALGVDPARFPEDAGLGQVNQAIEPRFGRLYGYAKRTVTRLHRADHTWVVDLAKKLRIQKALAREATASSSGTLDDEMRSELYEFYSRDTRELAGLTGLDVSSWRMKVTS